MLNVVVGWGQPVPVPSAHCGPKRAVDTWKHFQLDEVVYHLQCIRKEGQAMTKEVHHGYDMWPTCWEDRRPWGFVWSSLPLWERASIENWYKWSSSLGGKKVKKEEWPGKPLISICSLVPRKVSCCCPLSTKVPTPSKQVKMAYMVAEISTSVFLLPLEPTTSHKNPIDADSAVSSLCH